MALDPDPDAALLAQIARGDQKAAVAFTDRRLAGVMALAVRMLGDQAAAEDVAQDAFLRVWKIAPRWRSGEAKVSTWLHRVVINLCYDRLRSRRETPTDTPPDQVDGSPTGFETAQAVAIGRAVAEAMRSLPPRQRAVIALCHYQELSNIEAAEVMEISVEAVESLLSRARRALREKLTDQRLALLEETGDTVR